MRQSMLKNGSKLIYNSANPNMVRVSHPQEMLTDRRLAEKMSEEEEISPEDASLRRDAKHV